MTANILSTSVRTLLLARRGVVFVDDAEETPEPGDKDCLQAFELELAEIGYVVSTRLRSRLSACSPSRLTSYRDWIVATLLEHVGGDEQHVPLFRRFPQDVPNDTLGLW